jgi:hypothetical protein
VFVDSRPLALSNVELGKLDLCNGGLGSHLLEPLKSSWHTDALSDPVTFRCIPLAFADLCSLATGGELPEVSTPSTQRHTHIFQFRSRVTASIPAPHPLSSRLIQDCQPGWLNWNVRYGQCIGTCYREFTSLSQSRQLFNAYATSPHHNPFPLTFASDT